MLGSLTTPGRTTLAMTRSRVLPSDYGNTVGTRDEGLSRLNGQPARSPADASPLPSRSTTHGSGPMWIATPSS